jgi:carbohydrate-selective porin OprB
MRRTDMRWLTTVALLLIVAPAQAQVLNYDEIFKSPNLTGDWGGERPRLEDQGIQAIWMAASAKAQSVRDGWSCSPISTWPRHSACRA